MRAIHLDQIVDHRSEKAGSPDRAAKARSLRGDLDVGGAETRDPFGGVALRRFPGDALLAGADKVGFPGPPHRHEVRDAHKVENEGVGRPLKDLPGIAGLANPALVVHDRQAVRDGQGDFLVVRDIEDGDVQFALQFLDFEPHFFAQVGVQVGQRLVQKHQGRVGDQRPGQGHALLLPAGKFRRQTLLQTGHADHLDGFHDAVANLILRPFGDLQGIGDILEYTHVRPDRVILKDHTQAAAVGGDVDACGRIRHDGVVDGDSARVGGFKTGDQAQQNGLATTRRSQQGETLALLDGKREILVHLVVAVTFRDTFYPDNFHTRPSLTHQTIFS